MMAMQLNERQTAPFKEFYLLKRIDTAADRIFLPWLDKEWAPKFTGMKKRHSK
jgi:hypothetical protein